MAWQLGQPFCRSSAARGSLPVMVGGATAAMPGSVGMDGVLAEGGALLPHAASNARAPSGRRYREITGAPQLRLGKGDRVAVLARGLAFGEVLDAFERPVEQLRDQLLLIAAGQPGD